MRGRCERHQLALGPSGCLLCRRDRAADAAPAVRVEDAPPVPAASTDAAGRVEAAAPAEVPPGASAQPTRVATATPTLGPRRLNIEISPWLLLLPGAALGIYLISAWPSGTEVERAARADENTAAAAEVALEPADNVAARAELTGEARAPEAAQAPEAAPDEPELEADDSVDAPSAAVEDRERGPELGRPRQLDRERQLADAREHVDITVYYTSWCPACRAARGYLSERGIRFVEHDVERDSRAKSQHKLLNPKGSIPTIDIEGQVLVGFNPTKIERAIDRAARQRLAR